MFRGNLFSREYRKLTANLATDSRWEDVSKYHGILEIDYLELLGKIKKCRRVHWAKSRYQNNKDINITLNLLKHRLRVR